MITLTLFVFGVVIACFLLIVFFGAPYVPTHMGQVHKALEMLNLPEGSLLVDLGSGDGVVLKEAAKRNLRAVGYELNPLMALVSLIRCWKYRDRVKVHCKNFWQVSLPSETDVIFIFLAGPYMKRFASFLERQHKEQKAFLVVSYGFEIPGKKAIRASEGLFLYKY